MDGMTSFTTADVLDRLARLGLDAPASLDNDVRDGFLPRRERVANPAGRGRTSLWEPWMVQRAERLYRLRKKKGPDGKPLIYGDVLRLLLFLRDGWGWSQSVRELSLVGFDKGIAATRAPVGRRLPKKPTREDVGFALDLHVEDDREVSKVERYAIGMLTVGRPLEGGSLRPLFDEAYKAGLVPAWYVDALTFLDARFTARAVPGFEIVLRASVAAIGDSTARAAIGQTRAFLLLLRRAIRRAYVLSGNSRAKTNLITMFGRNQRELERDFRESQGAQRVTPAQCLAYFIAIEIAVEVIVDEAYAVARNIFPFLQWLSKPLSTRQTAEGIITREPLQPS